MDTMDIGSKLFWAFAIDQARPRHMRRRRIGSPKTQLERYRITALSPRLKAFGVKPGMTYKQAKQLVPEMRIIVCNR
ncbi:MAG: hypothetical protein WBP26_03495 [Candidatus Saccharimonadales bacterium]